jgi:hypothetical protein
MITSSASGKFFRRIVRLKVEHGNEHVRVRIEIEMSVDHARHTVTQITCTTIVDEHVLDVCRCFVARVRLLIERNFDRIDLNIGQFRVLLTNGLSHRLENDNNIVTFTVHVRQRTKFDSFKYNANASFFIVAAKRMVGTICSLLVKSR